MNLKKILITGANGQLGSELREVAGNYKDCSFLFTDINELDITDINKLSDFFDKNSFDFVVNCAAYTAVDKAETEHETAGKINTLAAGCLAKLCNLHKTKLIHISTDFVFDGKSNIPYKEDDAVNPLSVYGKTKLAGESEILKTYNEFIIIRTSWLYSFYGNNFVKTMIRLGQEQGRLNVVFDQAGTPTYARDLALTIMFIIEQNDYKFNGDIFHYSNEGVTSWYDFAVFITRFLKIDCDINPIHTFEYKTLATRPAYSVLDKSKIKKVFGIKIPHWENSAGECLKKIQLLKK